MLRPILEHQMGRLRAGHGFRHRGIACSLLVMSFALLAAGLIWWAASQHAEAQGSQTFVTNFDQDRNGTFEAESGKQGYGQQFTTGSTRGGYLLDRVVARVEQGHESRFISIEGALHTVTSDGSRGSKLFTFTHAGDFENNNTSNYKFDAPNNWMLLPDTSYMFVIGCIKGCANDNCIEFAKTTSNAEDVESEDGWTTADRVIKASLGWVHDAGVTDSLVIRVEGRPANAAYTVNGGIKVTSEPVAVNDTDGIGETIKVKVDFTSKSTSTRRTEYHNFACRSASLITLHGRWTSDMCAVLAAETGC